MHLVWAVWAAAGQGHQEGSRLELLIKQTNILQVNVLNYMFIGKLLDSIYLYVWYACICAGRFMSVHRLKVGDMCLWLCYPTFSEAGSLTEPVYPGSCIVLKSCAGLNIGCHNCPLFFSVFWETLVVMLAFLFMIN